MASTIEALERLGIFAGGELIESVISPYGVGDDRSIPLDFLRYYFAQPSASWQIGVAVKSTANVVIATDAEIGDVINGFTLTADSRFLLAHQSTGSENGVYLPNASGAPTRVTDYDADAEVTTGDLFYVHGGTVSANTVWELTSGDPNLPGTDTLTFAEWTPPPRSWKEPVRVATTANGALATAYDAGDTIDGITLAVGDRILLKNQTAGAENGIRYCIGTGTPIRAIDADVDEEVLSGMSVFVSEGTVNGGKNFQLTTVNPIVVDTTALVFAELSGGGGGSLNVKDENLSVVAAATALDFAGDGVTVTDDGGNEALITIPGVTGNAGLTEISSHDLSAGSISEVVVDITGFDYVLITYQDLVTSASTTVRAEMGVGPSTWRTGASDYQYSYFNDTVAAEGTQGVIFIGGEGGATDHFATIEVRNAASASHPTHITSHGHSATSAQGIQRSTYRTSNEVITHLRIFPGTGTFSDGLIRVQGLRTLSAATNSQGTVWAERVLQGVNVTTEYIEVDLPTGVEEFKIEFREVFWAGALSSDNFTFEISDDDGSTWETAASFYTHSRNGYDGAGTVEDSTSAGATQAEILGVLSGITTAEDGLGGYVHIRRQGTNDINVSGHLHTKQASQSFTASTPGSAAVPNKIRFYAGITGTPSGNNYATLGTDAIVVSEKRLIGGLGIKKYCVVTTDGTDTGLDFTTAADVPWNTETDDPDGWHDNVTNNERITPTGIADGFVDINATCYVTAATTGEYIYIRLFRNGTEISRMHSGEVKANAPAISFTALQIPFAQGDYYTVRLQIQTDASVTLNAQSRFVVREV